MLFHRGDVGEDIPGALVRVPDPFSGEFGWGNTTAHPTATPQYRTRTWIEGVDGIPSPGDTTGTLVLAPGDSALAADALSASDEGGQLTHDWSAGTVIIDTARSQGGLGFIGGLSVAAADVAIRVETPPFAVVMVTSLDGQPIAQSGRLLVSAVARAENTGQSYERSVRWTKVDEGDGPTLIEPVAGNVTLPSRDGTYEAWALDPLGQRTTAAPLSAAVLELGSASATSIWYEVVFQPSTADPGEDVLVPEGETGVEEGQEAGPERPDEGAETQGGGGDEGCGCALVR